MGAVDAQVFSHGGKEDESGEGGTRRETHRQITKPGEADRARVRVMTILKSRRTRV